MIKAILTDIEGTTTKISFVAEVLFPYAYQHLPQFLAQHAELPEVKNILAETRQVLENDNLSLQQLTEQFLLWIKQDKKITPLKTLQGLIWKKGYASGDLTSHIYPDAAEQLALWRQQGLSLAIFSSGSILAQKLLFAHTPQGDITPWFSGYFDTTSGPKNDPDSYQRIAAHLKLAPTEILFLSDAQAELDAAQTAGLHTYGLAREPNIKIVHHRVVDSFFKIDL